MEDLPEKLLIRVLTLALDAEYSDTRGISKVIPHTCLREWQLICKKIKNTISTSDELWTKAAEVYFGMVVGEAVLPRKKRNSF